MHKHFALWLLAAVLSAGVSSVMACDTCAAHAKKDEGAAKTEAASGAAPGEAAGPGKEAKVLSAAGAKVDLSMLELLSRRYVVDQVVMDAPQLLIERRADGGTNVGDIGGAPPEEGAGVAAKEGDAPPEG